MLSTRSFAFGGIKGNCTLKLLNAIRAPQNDTVALYSHLKENLNYLDFLKSRCYFHKAEQVRQAIFAH